jgi:polyphenol oxidase
MDPNFFQLKDGFLLYHQRLAAFKWIVHGFSLRRGTRLGEEKSMGFNDYQPRDVVESNRQNLVRSVLGSPVASGSEGGRSSLAPEASLDRCLVTLRQIHSDIIHPLHSFSPDDWPREGDALITAQPGILLSVQTADCMPILIADDNRRVVAAVHAGWRGILKRIVEKTVAIMKEEFATNPADCVATVGPSIRGCCYQVGEEVIRAFDAEFDYAQMLFREAWEEPAGTSRAFKRGLYSESVAQHQKGQPGKKFQDLPTACKQQLLRSGMAQENIFADPPCTSCSNNLFFSHRVESGKTGRMMSVIGMIEVKRRT